MQYEKEYPVEKGNLRQKKNSLNYEQKIPFASFINQMSFWMATGSGKTLVIVKLIRILGDLMRKEEIPKKDILFLAHRDDLLNQFSEHNTML